MNRTLSDCNKLRAPLARALVLFLLGASFLQAQTPAQRSQAALTSEQQTARYFETLRKSPPKLFAFLLQMPKGGDLHSHLSGAVYAESYIKWAAADRLCVNTLTMALFNPTDGKCGAKSEQLPSDPNKIDRVLYNQMIDAWSMRNWKSLGLGHDHFFDAFGKFGAAAGHTGDMLAEVVRRAARGHVLYLELMLTPDGYATGIKSIDVAGKITWNDDPDNALAQLEANGIGEAYELGVKNVREAESRARQLLKCDTPKAEPGCRVTVRFIAQVARSRPAAAIFAQMVTGYLLANDPKSHVVALNLVQGEDSDLSMANFTLHMKMLQALAPHYRNAHLTLHAGELVPALFPPVSAGQNSIGPAGSRAHIFQSVMVAGAERIGHGVDILSEDHSEDLLREMARRPVMVEICLSSNDLILGVRGPQHPLATYLKYGVPVALATDDEGVSRSELSREFLKGVEDQGLDYLQLKMMARNSLQYSFIAGPSLWSDGRKFVPVPQCTQDVAAMQISSSGCREFMRDNDKANLQWRLEQQLREFETGISKLYRL